MATEPVMPALSQAAVVVAERGAAARGLEQLQRPEPELAPGQAVAAPAQAVPGEAAARLAGFGIPTEQFAQLTVVTEAGDVGNRREQDRHPQRRHGWEAGQDR